MVGDDDSYNESRGGVTSALEVDSDQNVYPFTLSQSGSAVRRMVPSDEPPLPPLPKKLPV